jgi:hypothetical protein
LDVLEENNTLELDETEGEGRGCRTGISIIEKHAN